MKIFSAILYKLITGGKVEKRATVDFFEFLINTSQNRLLYWFSQKFRDIFDEKTNAFLKEVYLWGKQKKDELNKTLNLIENISKEKKLEYIIAKQDRTFPYVGSDIDLLVKKEDLNEWLAAFKNADYTAFSHKEFFKEKVRQKTLIRDNYYKIDLTTQFYWQEKFYFDLEFLWNNYHKKNHRLNKEADFLVNFTTIIFKRMSFNLLDYWYLKELIRKDLGWKLIEDQVKKYHWFNAYKKTLAFLSTIDPVNDSFPVMFPSQLYLTIFWEKLKNREFSINYFSYFVLARLRYFLLNKRHLPFHVYWYPYKDLKKAIGQEIQI